MSKNDAVDLQLEQLRHYMEKLEQLFPFLEKGADKFSSLREYVQNEITKFAFTMKTAKLDKDELNGFLDHPYVIFQEKRDKVNEWHIAIPKIFSGINLGWLDRVTPSHNIFLVNRFSDWFGQLPKVLKQELKMKDPLDIRLTADKKYLEGKDIDKAQEKYGRFIKRKEGDKLEIDPSKYFQFLANLIDDGILPFSPAPIDEKHLRDRTNPKYELRPYQDEAWAKFLKFGNIGVYYPPSTGKTFIGMFCMQRVKVENKRWIIVVPRTTLIEQWRENIQDFTEIQESEYLVCTYQMAIKKYLNEEFTGMIIDESHHMPSDYFVHLSKIKRHYTLGLTATPQREDGREDYIIALTGQPVGLSWDYFRRFGIIQSPESHIWIVKNETERIEKLKRILNSDDKITLIFSDSLKMGEDISKKIGIPFIHGETKDKLNRIRDSLAKDGIVIASRIADEGISLKNIQRVIEVSWLFGSRHQELQRMTRLLHAADKTAPGIHHVIMTAEEWNRDHKRFWSSMDKGFKLVMHREGEDEKVFQMGHSSPVIKERRPRIKSTVATKANVSKIHEDIDEFESKHEILSLPGIQKKLAACTRPERLSVRVMYKEPGKEFTKEDVWNKVGIGRVRDFASFDKLVELKLIKKVGAKTYQAA